jgi:hypothetical protein
MFLNFIEKAYAANIPPEATALLQRILDYIINPLVALVLGVAVIFFLWGVFQFIRNADNPEERKKGGMNMIYGVLGLFIMLAAYGILNLILGTIRPN